MKNNTTAYLLILILILQITVYTQCTIPTTREIQTSTKDLELHITIEKTIIKIGKTVNITLALKNVGTEDIKITFTTCQKFDLIVANESFSWLWSTGKSFCLTQTEITLKPRETFSETLRWNFYWFDSQSQKSLPPAPGRYYLIGTCMGTPTPIQEIMGQPIVVYLTPRRVSAWAAILEMNNFPEGWSSFPSMNFENSRRMVQTLLQMNWREDHIHVVRDNLTFSVVKEALDWLINNVNFGDIAIFYIFTHGGWMRWQLNWNSWFPGEWRKVNTPRRILMIDTCFAGEFIERVRGDPEPHISLAHCSSNEVAWAGIPEEGLPILGSVWNYYFLEALNDLNADLDGNGYVSVEEAFNFSTPLVQEYMRENVFTVPEFLQSYHDLGIYPENYDAYPHPVMDDQYPEQLFLDLNYDRFFADLNGDGRVNIMDIVIIAKAFGSKSGEPRWNPLADVNNDGIIDILDISMVAGEFGEKI